LRGGLAICGSLALFGSSGALSGLAQDYSEEVGAPRNLEGFLHNTFTIIAVAALITAMLLVARASKWTPGWQRMTRLSFAAAVGVAVGGLVFLVAPESIQGFVQRCIYFFAIAWLVATAITALRQAPHCFGDPDGSPESSA